MPKPPVVTPVVPAAKTGKANWRFTTDKPAGNWSQPGFDDSSWRQGDGGFGSPGTPGAVIGTEWKSTDIWIRRQFTLPAGDHSQLQLDIYHDEDAEVFLNGLPAATLRGYSGAYITRPIPQDALKALRAGTNTIAIHCRQTRGGQFIDAGLSRVEPVDGE
jgi:hypothetical protein